MEVITREDANKISDWSHPSEAAKGRWVVVLPNGEPLFREMRPGEQPYGCCFVKVFMTPEEILSKWPEYVKLAGRRR
jgi:hypothetical protein